MKSRQKSAAVVDRPVVMRPIDGLVPYARNARTHSDAQVAQIAASIREFGWTNPVLIDEDGGIIAGHGRVLAARVLGQTEVPCITLTGLTKVQRRAYVLADNRLALNAGWDDEMLRLELADLKADGFDLALTGFDGADIAGLLDATDGLTDEDDVPDVPTKPITVPGDVWLLGKHRIVCGDCRSFSDVEKVMAGEKAALAVTSPPYASQRKYDESSGFKPIPPDEYVEWFQDVQANVRTILADDGSWFVNIKEHCEDGQRHLYVKDLTIAHVRQWGWMFKDENVWKHHGKPGRVWSTFKNQWEPVFHFSLTKRPKCRPKNVSHASLSVPTGGGGNMSAAQEGNADGGFNVSAGMAYPGNVIECGHSEGGHPAAYPVGLPEFFVKAYSDKGDHVYEPFSGSGTTIIACEQTGRACHAIELSPAYVDVAVKRWQSFTGKAATLEGDGRTFDVITQGRA